MIRDIFLPEPGCFEVITDMDSALFEALPEGARYFVVGGIATAALVDPETHIDHNERMIFVRKSADISATRPNGTQRDVDILVDAVLTPEQATRAKKAAEEVVDGHLEVSLFGFDNQQTYANERFHFLSRRLMSQNDQRAYQLGPLLQPTPVETYEPWNLVLPNDQLVGVLNPVGHLLAYRMRSVSGLRPKDHEKFGHMHQNIEQSLGSRAFREQLHDGPFASWNAFANAAAAIRIGDPKHIPAEMLREGTTTTELAVMRWQGRLLRTLESQERLVTFAQGAAMQRALKPLIRHT
ncbi:MAG: hypothetical protein ACQR33_02850 [Candidatus Saccharibacteria bacterium]